MHKRHFSISVIAIALSAAALPAAPLAAAPPWSAVTPVSSGSAIGDVAVAADPAGDAAAVWVEAGGVMVAMRPPAGTWSEPQTLSGDGVPGTSAAISADESGIFTAAWVEDGAVEVATGAATGGWTPATTLPATSAFGLRLAVAPSGRAALVWNEPAVGAVGAIRSTATSAWGTPLVLSDAPWVNSVDVGIDDSGVALASWSSGADPVAREAVEVSVRPVGGAWSDPDTLSDDTAEVAWPQLAVNGAGAATVAWYESRDQDAVVVAASRNDDGTWTTPEDLSDPFQVGLDPQVALAPDGGTVVVWNLEDGGSTQAVHRPAGGSWSEVVDLSNQSLGGSSQQQVVAAPDGTFTVAWVSSSDDGRAIRTARLRPSGSWAAPVYVTDPADDSTRPRLAVDGQGNVTAVFDEPVGFQFHVAAASLDTSAPTIGVLTVPAAGTVGQSLAYSAGASDQWSSVASYSWSFGDGATATGTTPTHAYVAPGSYPVTLTVADGVGNTTTRTGTTTISAASVPPLPPPPPPPAPSRPEITLFFVKDTRIQAVARTAAEAPDRTKLKLRLSAAAKVRVVLTSKHRHLVSGERKHVKVVLTRRLPSGGSAITLKGRLATIKLLPDTYRIVGTARNAAGSSPAARARLVVVAPLAASRIGDPR